MLFFLVVFAVVWLLTSLTPLIADDYNYAFTWADEGIGRIDNFYLIYTSMQSHRMWTHGRVFAQGWVSLFMMWPKHVFNLANAAVLTSLLVAVYHFFLRSQVGQPLLSTAVVGMLYWICMPAYGQVFLWLDGSCNYSWGGAFGFLLIEMTQSARKTRFRMLYTILLMPFSFVVGAWSEHISFAVLVVLFLLWLSEWVCEKHVPVHSGLILFSGCGGYLFLMLAPSMLPSILKYRAKEAAGGYAYNLLSLIEQHWWLIPIVLTTVLITVLFLCNIRGRRKQLMMLSELTCWVVAGTALICGFLDAYRGGFFGFMSSTPFGFLTLLALFLGGLKRALKYHVNALTVLNAVFLAVGGISGLVLFVFAMYFPARSFCAPVLFMGIAAVLLWSAVKQKEPQENRLIISLAVAFAIFFSAGLFDILSVHRQAMKRKADIRQAQLTDGILVAEPYRVWTKYSAQYGLLDLAPGESWPNDYVKEYYRLREIIVVPTEEKA